MAGMDWAQFKALERELESTLAAALRHGQGYRKSKARAAEVGAIKHRRRHLEDAMEHAAVLEVIRKRVEEIKRLLLRSWVEREEGEMKSVLARRSGRIAKIPEVGDELRMDDTILTIEDDKAACDLRCVAPGRVVKRFVNPGDTVEAGQALFIIARPGETLDVTPAPIDTPMGLEENDADEDLGIEPDDTDEVF